MATKTIIKGQVEFQGATIALGSPVLVNGRKGVPFMAWVRDNVAYDGHPQHPNTTIRVKWEGTYMPSDFNDRFGARAQIEAAA